MRFTLRWPQAFSALLAVLLLFSVPSFAQTFRGSINGTITDPSGAVIPGAKVTAIDVATSVSRETVSTGAGEFSFADLPTDVYTVKVEASGFQKTEVTGVDVLAGKIYTLPVKLALAAQATTVEVAADTLSLDTTTITQTTTLESKALQDVPLNGRDFTQLLGTSAAFSGYNNNGSVNGTRNDQLNYTINGTDNNDLYLNAVAANQGSISGIAGVVYPIDALDEYSLQTTGNSESGRSPGGNLNLNTKSGTNSIHGTVYYFNRNEALAALSPFTPSDSPASPLRNQNYGFSLGGPIWHDHTFLFLTYEEQKFVIGLSGYASEPSTAYVNEALAVLANVGPQGQANYYGNYAPVTPSVVSQNIINTLWDPSLTAGLPGSPNNLYSSAPESGYSHNIVAHLDHNFSDRSHLSAIWYFGQGFADAPYGSDLPEYFQSVPSHIQNYNLVWNYSIKPNLTNQVAAGVSYFVQAFADAVHNQDPLALAGLNMGVSLSGAPQIAINGFDQIGVTPTSGRQDISGQLADTLSWTVGKHQFRFGAEYRRAYIDLYYNFGGRGYFAFNGQAGPWSGATIINPVTGLADSNINSLADYLAGYPYQYSDTLGTQERTFYTHTGALFAQDSWQVAPKLNINLGLRYDYQQPFYGNQPNTSIFDPNNGGLVVVGGGPGTPNYIYQSNKLDVSPRIGIAYQATPGTVIRANYGLYFDQPAGQAFYGNIGIPNGGAGGVNNNPAGSEPNYSLFYNTPTDSEGNPIPVWTYNQTTPIFTAAAGEPTGSNVVSLYSVDRHFKTPYVQLFGLNVEQSLGKAWQLNVGYVGSLSRHNLYLNDINQSAPGSDASTATVTGSNGGTFSYQQSTRPYFSQFPNFGVIDQLTSGSSANYNALQITLKSGPWHGLTSQFAYAWSHNLDTASGFNTNPQDSTNPSGDYGNSAYDVRNHFAAYLNYAIPAFAHGPKALTNGWEINSVLKFQNGLPVNILTGADNSGTGENEDRATLIGPAYTGSETVHNNSPVQYLTAFDPTNTTGFVTPGYGTYGTLGRNQITAPGFSDVDLSLLKTTNIYKERVKAQFRVEMFNVFNRVNLAAPLSSLGDGASFGQSTSTIGNSYGAPGIGSGEPFNTQLALKILF